jgi:hypothetical protein
MFSYIAMNKQGMPLVDFETVINLNLQKQKGD